MEIINIADCQDLGDSNNNVLSTLMHRGYLGRV
jgi:hypothetical protein